MDKTSRLLSIPAELRKEIWMWYLVGMVIGQPRLPGQEECLFRSSLLFACKQINYECTCLLYRDIGIGARFALERSNYTLVGSNLEHMPEWATRLTKTLHVNFEEGVEYIRPARLVRRETLRMIMKAVETCGSSLRNLKTVELHGWFTSASLEASIGNASSIAFFYYNWATVHRRFPVQRIKVWCHLLDIGCWNSIRSVIAFFCLSAEGDCTRPDEWLEHNGEIYFGQSLKPADWLEIECVKDYLDDTPEHPVDDVAQKECVELAKGLMIDGDLV